MHPPYLLVQNIDLGIVPCHAYAVNASIALTQINSLSAAQQVLASRLCNDSDRVQHLCRWIPPAMTLAGAAHQTAAQRGGEAKDKDRPLSDMQRDR